MKETVTRILIYLSIAALLGLNIGLVSYIFDAKAQSESRHIALYQVTTHETVTVENDDGTITTEFAPSASEEIPGARERKEEIMQKAHINTILASIPLIAYGIISAIVLVPHKKYMAVYSVFIVATTILFVISMTMFYSH